MSTLILMYWQKPKRKRAFQQGIEMLPQLHYRKWMAVHFKIRLWAMIFLLRISKFLVHIVNTRTLFKLSAHNENVSCIKFFHLWSICNPCWWFMLICMLMIINVARWGVGNYSLEPRERLKLCFSFRCMGGLFWWNELWIIFWHRTSRNKIKGELDNVTYHFLDDLANILTLHFIHVSKEEDIQWIFKF